MTTDTESANVKKPEDGEDFLSFRITLGITQFVAVLAVIVGGIVGINALATGNLFYLVYSAELFGTALGIALLMGFARVLIAIEKTLRSSR